MIKSLSDIDVLIKLESHQDVLKFLVKLSPSELALFQQIQNWPVPLLSILSAHTDVLKFLVKLAPSELSSFAELQEWSAPMLTVLRDHPDVMRILYNARDMLDDTEAFCRAYSQMAVLPGAQGVNITDAFSQGQLNSKRWLLDTAESLGLEFKNTWTLCGWIGTLGYLMMLRQDRLHLTSVRSFDIDDRCAALADTLNRLAVKDGWQFKATTMDVNQLTYDDFSYQTKKYDGSLQTVVDSVDTIINTSCDHMGNDKTWWDRIPSGRTIILQNNDWYENDQHNNSAKDLNEFKQMYPMNELLYAGELDCTLYTRFMLIGSK